MTVCQFLFLSNLIAQAPVIASFSPVSGPIGTTVIITGSNFNTTAANNTVYFGAVKAAVSAATTTSLTVTVPVGTTYQPVTVTANNLTAYATQSFAVTFPSNVAGITPNSFAAKADFAAGSDPASVAVGDFDGDGKADMVCANLSSNTLSVFRNTGSSGNISFAAKVDYPTGVGPVNVVIGDLNGDGKPDVVVANNSSASISIYKNTSVSGAISFAPKIDYTGGSRTNSIAVGDLDGDGKPDLAVANTLFPALLIFKNTSVSGTISFNAGLDLFIGNYTRIAISDLDGDGKPDLVGTDGGSGLSAHRNTSASGTISFAAVVNFTTGNNNSTVSIGDVDGDGKCDLAVATGASGVSVLRNTSVIGAVSFAGKADFAAGLNPRDLAMGDLDGDGKPDLAIANSNGTTVSVLKNTGSSGTVSFAPSVDFPTGQYPYSVAVADMDGDGKPDLAVADHYNTSYAISVIKNQTDGPNVASFAPANAGVGTTLTITGTNFTGATAVSIGGIAASGFTVVSDVQISAVVPVVTGGLVVVSTPNGTATLGGFYNGPAVASVSPVNGAVGAPVTITGSNFNSVAAANVVYFGAVKASVSAASATSITATVPTGITFEPVTVTTGNRTAYSSQSFAVAFPSNPTGITPNSFAAKVDYSVGNGSNGLVIGDLDGDGKADMVSSNYNVNSILVFRNTGSPSVVSYASSIPIVTGTGVNSIALGDLDGDGKTDIIVTNYSPGSVSVFRNTSTVGNISFAAKADVAVITGPASVTVSDIDGDGKPDVAVVRSGASIVSLLRNASNGGSLAFALTKDVTINSVTRVFMGDLDGDTKPEMVVANYYAGTVSVLKNTSVPGVFSFDPQVDYPTGNTANSAAIGDLDGDGKPDLAVANNGSATVSVLKNLSTGGTVSFASALNYATGNGPSVVSIADLDGDGKPDLAVANTSSYSVSVLKNTGSTGTMSFAAKVDLIPGGNVTSVAIGDLDGDGKPDLAITSSDQGTASILRNQTAGTDLLSFTPSNAPVGTNVTINGINFTGATAVSFGGIAATSFTVVSDVQITAVVASVAGGAVSVTSPKGTATLIGFYNGPVINSFSPASGPVGTTVTISGTNFNATAANNTVYFGAVKAVVSAASTTSLTVTVPVGASYQPFTVGSGTAIAYASKPFLVTFPGNIAAFTPGSFAAKQDYTAGANPGFVATGDLDGDGKPDMVVSNTGGNIISVYKNNGGPGNVSFGTKLEFGNGYTPTGISITDMNGDGKPDLVVIIYNSSSVYVYRNTSTGGTISFASEVVIYTGIGTEPRGIIVSDLDGDGKPDIAIANSAGPMGIFRNTTINGTLSFAQRQDVAAAGGSPYGIAVGDFDGDGKPDLALTNYTFSPSFVILMAMFRNQSVPGKISFADKKDFIIGSNPKSVSVGDFDGDGKADLAVANNGSNTVSVLRNTSAGGVISFASKIDYPTGAGPYSVSVGDFDGDEKPDLAVANSGSATVSLFKNVSTTGVISFAAKTDYTTGTTPQCISIGDLDGDGKPDMAVANAGSNSVSLLVNLIGSPVITSFTPSNGGIGTTITINGSLFTGTTAVSFGGFPAASFTVVSDAVITAVVGAIASGNVTVTTPGGIASLGGFYNGHSVTSFSPVSGPVGTVVTIIGLGFSPTAANNTVYFGAVKAAVSAATSTSLTVTVPAGTTYQPITVTTNNLTVYTAKPFVVTFASNASGFAPNSFAAKVDYATGINPSTVVIGDIDGDGKPDLVTASYNTINSNMISVLRNASAGTAASFAAKVDYTTGNLPFSIAIGDIDGDGKSDLVVANVGANTFSILKNGSTTGALSFAPKVDYVTETSPIGVAVGDLDGDGKPDLAVVNVGLYSVSVYKNTSVAGAISFAPRVNYGTGNFPYGVAIGDVDGDGKPDLVVVNANSNSVSVFRNTGTIGTVAFAAKTDYAVGGTPYAVVIGDVDGDGKPDLATANGTTNTVSVLRNTSSSGTVSFAIKVDYTTGTDPRSLAITDMDGDGKPDLAVANNSSNNLSVFRNGSTSGTIVFAAKVDYATGVNPRGVALGDLTGDGKPDLASANYGSNTVSILKNQLVSAELCAGGNISYTSNLSGGNYQWQVNTSSGFAAISNNANYAGSGTATLQLINLPSAWYGYQYRCVVDGANSNMYTLQFTNTWTGAVNNAWENASNWSCGAVPDGNVDVVIGSGTVVVSSAATCRSLKVSLGVSFTVSTGYNLVIAH